MPRRPLALATLVLALLFALARATPGAVAPPGAPPPLPGAHSTSGMSSQGATFESSACPQTPEPVPALATARCGFLVVPENRAYPSGRMIRLAVAIIPAVSNKPAPDPIVYMAGGPGVDPIGQETTTLVDAGVNRDRDLIIMDQRGTLYSAPALLCPEIDQFSMRAPLVSSTTPLRRGASTSRPHARVMIAWSTRGSTWPPTTPRRTRPTSLTCAPRWVFASGTCTARPAGPASPSSPCVSTPKGSGV
jgi:hypothetical protein